MPYPYTNELGKKPPPGSSAAGGYKSPATNYYHQAAQAKTELSELTEAIQKVSAEIKAEQQKKMMDQLFGATPSTIKFPNIQPKEFKPDFPKNSAASKYGKPDLKAIPPEGPAKLPWPAAAEVNTKLQAEYMSDLFKAGLITKEQFYKYMFPEHEKYKAKVLGEFPVSNGDPMPQETTTYYDPESMQWKTKEVPKPNFYGFTQLAGTPGDENSYKIDMKFKIDGLAGVDGKTLNAHQMVSKEFIYSQYGKSAVEKIVDDMLRQIKLEIMEQIKKAK